MKTNNVSTLIDATKAMIAIHGTITNIAVDSKNNPDEYACACMAAKMINSAIEVSAEILEHNDITFIDGDFYAKVDTINPTPVGNDEAKPEVEAEAEPENND